MMSQAELEQRRETMFREPSNASPMRVYDGQEWLPVAWVCVECGSLVEDQDSHFGHHLKLDNIDQRLTAVIRQHGLTS